MTSANMRFVNLDRYLTRLHGTLDCRFKFTDGQWSEEMLRRVFDQDDRLLRAWIIWNNVLLELWIQGTL